MVELGVLLERRSPEVPEMVLLYPEGRDGRAAVALSSFFLLTGSAVSEEVVAGRDGRAAVALSSFFLLTESSVSEVVEGPLGGKTASTWLHMGHKLKKDLANMMKKYFNQNRNHNHYD